MFKRGKKSTNSIKKSRFICSINNSLERYDLNLFLLLVAIDFSMSNYSRRSQNKSCDKNFYHIYVHLHKNLLCL